MPRGTTGRPSGGPSGAGHAKPKSARSAPDPLAPGHEQQPGDHPRPAQTRSTSSGRRRASTEPRPRRAATDRPDSHAAMTSADAPRDRRPRTRGSTRRRGGTGGAAAAAEARRTFFPRARDRWAGAHRGARGHGTLRAAAGPYLDRSDHEGRTPTRPTPMLRRPTSPPQETSPTPDHRPGRSRDHPIARRSATAPLPPERPSRTAPTANAARRQLPVVALGAVDRARAGRWRSS